MKTLRLLSAITLAILFTFSGAFAQKEITVEDIWRDYKFVPRSVPGFNFMNDGKSYIKQDGQQINRYDITTGDRVETLFDLAEVEGGPASIDGYNLSQDESKILVRTGTEAIYRRSSKANYYVYDAASKSLRSVTDEGKQMYATFSPDNSKLAYVRDNNIYVKDLTSGQELQITKDGEYNKIINGSADWVYEEEFSFAKAFFWSPDSKKIAYYRFDESEVKEFTMTNYRNDVYPEYQTFKYPKVGEDNAKVTIFIHHLSSGQKVQAEQDAELQEYIPRIQWTQDPSKLCVTFMNRHQNHLKLNLIDAGSGAGMTILEEKNKYYIDIHDNLAFLKDGKRFVWTSEQDGYNHIYLHTIGTDKAVQLTSGDWDVTDFYGADEKNRKIYFQAAKKSALGREIYESALFKPKGLKEISDGSGTHRAQWSKTYDYLVHTHSSAEMASSYVVRDRRGAEVRGLEDNKAFNEMHASYGLSPVEFFTVPVADGVELNAWRITPADFDESKKHPVLMFVYGGPGSQTVNDSWQGFNYWWYQMLAQKGYVIVSVDNRGTGARGQEFKKMTYQELGKYETMDQIAAAQYLAGQSYVDADRIGIWGWSYGGYMSSLAILKGNDVFKAAIAVAPVTNWKWYDTIYTERYMRTDDENRSGYADNSPVNFADRLKGKYLLIHGMGDDNVHFQNAVEMANALINANKQFDTYYYPNRNHGIYGGVTRLHLYNKMTDFLLENL